MAAKKTPKKKPPKGGGRKPEAFTAKEELFCREWIIDKNDTQAAIRAGYSKKTAGAIGHALLKKAKIRARCEKLWHEALLRADLTIDVLIQELKEFGFFSIKDFVGDNNTVLDLSKLPRELLKPVTGIKTTERYEDGQLVRSVELKMVDKKSAIVDLIRHLGGFEKDNAQRSIKIKVTRK